MSQIFLGLAKKWSFYKVNGANGRILYRVSVTKQKGVKQCCKKIEPQYFSKKRLHEDKYAPIYECQTCQINMCMYAL